MSDARARIGAVMRLELLTQRREPLTVLYMLTLGLLAGAFAAAGPVELVRHRGAVPRDAAWSMLLASTALTAFGQVITTMVAATVVLRDRHDGIDEQLRVTRLTRREYLAGKLLAALGMLAVIYLAVPVGLTTGAVWAGGSVGAAVRASVLPFVLLVLPTMLAVGALQFALGVLSGRLWAIVAQGLLLIWLWSACVDAAQSSSLGAAAAVIDPFGSTGVLRATAAWTDAERATRAMPLTLGVVAGRVVWLVLGAGAVALVMRGANASRRVAVAAGQAATVVASAPGELQREVVRGGSLSSWRAILAVATYVAHWMLRDTGWRVLAVLGSINVGLHAFLDGRVATPGVGIAAIALAALHQHARLFLILLATIYAGELTWRERDERSAALFDALPVGDAAMLGGRVLGAVVAQCVVVCLLSAAALVGAAAGARGVPDVLAVMAPVAHTVLWPFVAWMLLSLSVHAVVQHKVAAHLICIAVWVLAVVTSRAEAFPADGDRLGAGWAVAVAVSVMLTRAGWIRGTSRLLSGRMTARRSGSATSES